MNKIKAYPKTKHEVLASLISFVLIMALFTLIIPAEDVSAGIKIAFNDEEYNIYTEDYPDLISDNIYAKFTTSVSDPDTYKFSMISDEALDPFKSALQKKNIKCEDDLFTAFNIKLLQETEDDDKEVYKSATVYVPLPDDAQEYPDYCTFYKVSGGTASVMPSRVYTDEEDINYVQIILSGKADYSPIYGFVFEDPSELEAEEEEDEEVEEEEEEEEEDEDEEEAATTSAPTASPTKAPTKTPTKEVTKAPAATKGGSKTSTPARKDNSPKTGDEMNFVMLGLTGLSATGVLVTTIVLQVRSKIKKKENTEDSND